MYKSDFVKYLIHAHAECDETIVHLGFLFETRSLANEDAFHQLTNDYFLLAKESIISFNGLSQKCNLRTCNFQPVTCTEL